ncbi:hypothetical protein [Bradyrhizobium sp. 21]|uniref:hypothetical protein n=1 Tax=Bradyrhizobium sp. 21 TaxID=2782666 RepID=UPI001FF75A06|nr:hypothetical protein [Bradyrhizobium sp. 21]MCK1389012.1 hypothetical protein [Bradyrhizobium sp. 21]
MEWSLDHNRDLVRPRTFKDILGHERWFESLIANLKQERGTNSHQPIALIGCPGVGKRTLARMYAKALVCEQELTMRSDAAPCNICHECRAIDNSSLAFHEKDARTVGDNDDDDRELEKAQAEAVHTLIEREVGLNTASVRIVLFKNAEAFSSSTADIALKTLEQEITSTVYVFTVNDEARFSGALRSRCNVYRVGPISVADLVGRLSLICEHRSVPFDEAALRAIAVEAAGSFGAALAIMGRVERRGDVTIGNLLRLSEFGWGSAMVACWEALLEGRRDEAVSLFEAIGADGPMSIKAVQAFLVECRIRQTMGTVPAAASVSPALDCLPPESWISMFGKWRASCQEAGTSVDEEIDRALCFWASVKVGTPWRAAFARGCEVLFRAGEFIRAR